MNINMEFYKDKEEELSENENKILEIFLKGENYNDIIEREPTVNNYIHLSQVKENLLNWYDFKKNSSFLEIGAGFGELTNLLINKGSKVVSIEQSLKKAKALEKRFEKVDNLEVIVGDFLEINIENKFDYIIITDYLEKNDFQETLKKAEKFLKSDGTFLIAMDNKYGIKNWKGKDDYKTILDEKLKSTKKCIEENLNDLGFTNYKFYYIYPEYKAPNLIYTDNYKITIEDISRNFELNEVYEENSFRENELLKNLLNDENDIINFFANSFLIEISNINLSDVKYITFTNYRKIDKQIQTIITSDKVIKRPINKESELHIKKMIENQQHFPKNNCVLLDKKGNDISIESDYIVGKRLDEIINNNVQNEFDKYKEFLFNCNDIIPYDEINKDELMKPLKELDDETLKMFNFVEYGFVDMIPKNCFVIGGMNFFFDQEWMIKFIPLEFILYRSIVNSSIRSIDMDSLFEKYNLSKYKDLFKDIEDCFVDMVFDKTILSQILSRPAILKNDRINLLKSEVNQLENKNKELEMIVKDRDNQLVIIANSFSWKITKPIRWISAKARKLFSKIR